MTERSTALSALDPLVGHWRMAAQFGDAPPAEGDAQVGFEWLPGGRFLVQRWSAPLPEGAQPAGIPTHGIAMIGVDPSGDGFLQHYFDSRGVARVYQMTVTGGIWRLWRDEADFSPLDFRQRFSGVIGDDGRTIEGAWEICHDGTTWQPDFALSYRKLP